MKMDTTINYFDVKNEIEKQLILLGEISQNVKVSYEKEEFQLRLKLENINDSSFLKVILLAKKHIENWRIHTFEKGYLSLQALNKDLFSSEGILKNLKDSP